MDAHRRIIDRVTPPTSAPLVSERRLHEASSGVVLLHADDRRVYRTDRGEVVATFSAHRVWRGDTRDAVPIADVVHGAIYPHGGFHTDPIAVADDDDPAHAALLAVFHLLFAGEPARLRP